MTTGDNLIHLAFASPETVADTLTFSACVACRNKTFVVLHDREDEFPMMRCAACGADIGRVGWADC